MFFIVPEWEKAVRGTFYLRVIVGRTVQHFWCARFYAPGTAPPELTIDLDPTPANSGDWTVSLSVGNTSLATDQAISEAPSMISHIGFTRFEGRGGEVPMLS